ncbi:MAG: hypothetical protein NTX45_20295 [Proteobacteria bacterium]|nr:hypothetical protein [Pseudomonadota bacterium]
MRKIQLDILDIRMGKAIPFLEYATLGSAGIDLRVRRHEPLDIAPGEACLVPPCMAIQIAETTRSDGDLRACGAVNL